MMVFNSVFFLLVALCIVWELWLAISAWGLRFASYRLWSLKRHVLVGITQSALAILLCLLYPDVWKRVGALEHALNLQDYFSILSIVAALAALPLIFVGFNIFRKDAYSNVS